MRDASVEELKRRIASGRYPIDSRAVAEAILSKTAIIRRVKRSLMRQDEAIAGDQDPPGTRTRGQRPSRSAETQHDQQRERLS